MMQVVRGKKKVKSDYHPIEDFNRRIIYVYAHLLHLLSNGNKEHTR